MARRRSERLSDGSVDDDGAGRESWLSRSTIYAEEEDDDTGGGSCSWSQLYTPTPFEVASPSITTGTPDTKSELKEDASSSRNGKRRLPLLAGFSNSEALRVQLPRSTSKLSPTKACSAILGNKGLRKVNSSLKGSASSELLPSVDEVEANRRKWDLERKLQDSNRYDVALQNQDLRRKRHVLNPVVPSVAEVEANQRKWDLERKLQEADRIGMSVTETSALEPKSSMKRKLQTLNPRAMKMNPVVPSVSEVETNRRKWDLERKLQDADGFKGTVKPQQKRDFRRKLQNLNPFVVTPDTPSSAAFEAERKWDRERELQEADRNGLAVTVSGVFERKCDSVQKLPPLKVVASSVSGGESRQKKWQPDSRLYNLEEQLELKMQEIGGDDAGRIKLQALPSVDAFAMRQEQHEFEMSESLVYLLLFTSTAVLHCALFNFNSELRRFLRLDDYPFGVMLLLSWTFVGLIHFVGGLMGDLAHNRVVLLQRTSILWGVAVIAVHVAAFDLTPVVSSVSLVSGLLLAGVAHGVICPNVIALMVETKLGKFQAISAPFSPEEEGEVSSSEDDSGAESEASYFYDVSDGHQLECNLVSHNFFSGCFAARLAGSAVVQAYYFLLVDEDTLMNENSFRTQSRGFYCMLFMSFSLVLSLVLFSFQLWSYHPTVKSELIASERFNDERFQHKLESLEMEFTTSTDNFKWSWEKLVHLWNRALIGYVLLAFVLLTFIGVGFSLVVVLLASQTSLSIRLVAFLLIVTGWLLTMIASSRQLNPTKKKLLRVCRHFGFRSRQLYFFIFAAAFICVSGCVAFLRGQLYTTLVVQVCQTRLLIPGTINTLADPELLGTAVATSSLLLMGLARVLTKRPMSTNNDQVESSRPKETLVVATSDPAKTKKPWRLLPSLVSFPPVTRMCFAMLLYLIGIFLSSVVELYRRKAAVSPSVIPRSCGAVHSEFSFLWTSPYVVLLGASDALFRVSLQESCHDLARGSFASVPSRHWAGALQGAISLAEALGYTTALSLVAVLSRWLFRPELTDMALLFLLLTTAVALTHALLNRIAARAQAYQRLYFPFHSTAQSN